MSLASTEHRCLRVLPLVLVLAAFAAGSAWSQEAPIDPDCLEAGAACEENEECCSNRCVDDACAAEELDSRLQSLIASCPETSSLLDSWDGQPVPPFSSLSGYEHYELTGRLWRHEAPDPREVTGYGESELSDDGRIFFQWLTVFDQDQDIAFVGAAGFHGATGQTSAVWSAGVPSRDRDEWQPLGCWTLRSRPDGEATLEGSLATWRVDAASGRQDLEIFAEEDGERRPLFHLTLTLLDMLPRETPLDPECLAVSSACEDDGECCSGSCVDFECQVEDSTATPAVAPGAPAFDPAAFDTSMDPGEMPDVPIDPDCLPVSSACESGDECCTYRCVENVCEAEDGG